MIRWLLRRETVGTLALAGCVLAGAGCSATRGSRFRAAEGARSSAVVGGQTLPPTVGLSGSKVTVDTPDPEPRRDPKARISGRVVDDRGRPVAGAEVRLADGSSPVGRDVRTVTDDSGAFTLGGLRPGAGYLLVAEANFDDAQGTLTGQAEAETAATGVQIRLGDAASPRQARAESPRGRTVSDRVDGAFRPAADAGANAEDVDSPAAAADDDPDGLPAPRPRAGSKRSAGAAGWHKPGSPAPPAGAEAAGLEAAASDQDAPESTPAPRRARPAQARVAANPDPEDDPLPPALPAAADRPAPAPSTAQARPRPRPRARVVPRAVDPAAELSPPGELALGTEAAAVAPAAEAEPAAGPDGLEPMPSLASVAAAVPEAPAADPTPMPTLAAGDVAADAAQPPGSPPPGRPPSEATAPAPSLADSPASATSGDVVSPPADPSAGYNPFALVAADSPAAAAATAPDLPAVPASRAADGSIEPPAGPEPATVAAAAAATPPPKTKWGDLPPIAATAGGAVAAAAAARTVAAGTPPAGRGGSLFARRARPAAPTRADAPATSEFDARANRLVDFQLPDLNGDPVRFRDLDADYVLLDFWGTWCDNCVDSIPQLVALQKKYGPTKLKVVGIACEKTPPEKRKAVVAAAAQRLGINYSVLVTGLDDGCPVQRDFKVRFYPTMILLDRTGRILFTGEGATESNWYRLDKALKAAERAKVAARR